MIKKNLYLEVPHMGWRKIKYLEADMRGDYLNAFPAVLMEVTGRSACKSISNSMIHIVRLIEQLVRMQNDPTLNGLDILCMCFEQKSISHTVAGDIRRAIQYLEISEEYFNFNLPINSEKYIDIQFGKKKCRIWFAHGAGGYLNIKGYRPIHGNKWWCLWMYELDNFTTWNSGEIEMCISTLSRDADTGFHVCIEQNQPRAGTGGVWTLDYIAKKEKGEIVRKSVLAKNPNDQLFQRVGFEIVRYSCLDMYEDEFNKFINPVTNSSMMSLAISDRDTFDWVYLGKPTMISGSVLKNLSFDKHFGNHNINKYDYLSIGVDIGVQDACCANLCGVQFPDPYDLNKKDFKVQDGLEVCWHSNRWQESIFPTEEDGVSRPLIWEHKDVAGWLTTDFIRYLEHVCRKYQNYSKIIVNIEYAHAEIARYVSWLADKFAGTQLVFAQWFKGSVMDAVTFSQMFIATRCFDNVTPIYKCANRELFEGLASWRYATQKHSEEEDGEPKVYDNTDSREQKYFDLVDAHSYNFSADTRNTMREYLVSASMSKINIKK